MNGWNGVRGAAWFGLALLFWTQPSAASDASLEVVGHRRQKVESPQHFAIEARIGSYKPNTDEDPNLKAGAAPFESTFGGRRPIGGFELDWQALRIPHVGSVGPGASISYAKMTSSTTIRGTDIVSAEATSLQVVPVALLAVARFDVFDQDWGIPLVPYVKFGPAAGLWWSKTGETLARTDATAGGVPAKGTTYGTHFALGLGLDLNFFDGRTAKNFDINMGVNHTYLFIEYVRLDLQGVGQTNPLWVGDRTWSTGLAFEF